MEEISKEQGETWTRRASALF